MILLLFVVLLLFGSKAVPELGRSLGRFTSEVDKFKDAISSVEKELELPDKDGVLIVFLSSVMNAQDDLKRERLAIKSLFMNERLFSLWRFEDAPADDDLEATYLEKVRECHIFILIIGSTISLAVRKEFQVARDANKPILVFLKDGVERESEAQEFVADLTRFNLRYKLFESEEDLRKEALRASYHCVVKYYKHGLTQKTYLACLALLFTIEESDAKAERILEGYSRGDISLESLQRVEQRATSDSGYRVSENEPRFTSDSLDVHWYDAYFKQENYRAAIELSRELVRARATPHNFLRLAWSYNASGRREEAIRNAYKGYKLARGDKKEEEKMMRWIGFWTSGKSEYLFAPKRGAWL